MSTQRSVRDPAGATRAVGAATERVDGREKVTGSAEFVYDFDRFDLLYAALVHSPHASARIRSIDTRAAEGMAGVRAVITGEDVPDTRYGSGISDERVLPRTSVRHVGEPVAAVAAETPEAASAAAASIEVAYEPRDAVFTLEAARRRDPPAVVHEAADEYEIRRSHFERVYEPVDDRPNVIPSYTMERGDVDAGFERADFVLERTYRTAPIHHVQLEPHVSVARWDPDGLTIWSSTNAANRVKRTLGMAYGLPESRITVKVPYVGGSFGGKKPITEPIAAALSREAGGRPVKLAFSREEQFVEGTFRADTEVAVKAGVTDQGDLVALAVRAYLDSGAYVSTTFTIIRNGLFAAVGSYDVDDFSYEGYAVYTNRPKSSSFRGYGTPQVIFAVESHLGEIAARRGWDPIAFRAANLLDSGDRTAAGEAMRAVGSAECLRRVSDVLDGGSRAGERGDDWIYGSGVALGNKYSVAPTVSNASVKVHPDGRVEVRTAAEQIGTGTATALGQIAAEEFRVERGAVDVVTGDSRHTPYDDGAISSRITFNNGNAIRRACRDAKDQIKRLASATLAVDADELTVGGGEVVSVEDPETGVRIGDLFQAGLYSETAAVPGTGEIVGRGTWSPIDRGADGPREKLTAFYGHAAVGCAVAIHRRTGTVRIESLVVSCDAGRAINPALVEGQIEGCASMGIGSALYEQLTFDGGRVENPNLMEYAVPLASEHPLEIRCEIVETMDEDGPYGAKGVGETAIGPVPPAIGNAIRDALGVRLTSIPFEPEAILEAIEAGGA